MHPHKSRLRRAPGCWVSSRRAGPPPFVTTSIWRAARRRRWRAHNTQLAVVYAARCVCWWCAARRMLESESVWRWPHDALARRSARIYLRNLRRPSFDKSVEFRTLPTFKHSDIMSPASSGPLEVERYIGACLISSQQSRHKKNYHQHHHQGGGHHHQPQHHQQHQHHQNGLVHHPDNLYNYHRLQRCNSDGHWAPNGGVPLLYNHHYNPHVTNENLSRLAVQTQGIPLILSNKYHNRRNKHRNGNFANPGTTGTLQTSTQQGGSSGGVQVNVKDLKDVGPVKGTTQCTDTVSIASDESCASNASDTCLPRIIKPRKRRKKDRKPQHHLRTLQVGAGGDSAYSSAQDTCSSNGSATSSPDIDYFVAPLNNYYGFNYQHQQRQHKMLQEEKNETPKLSHLFEDVLEDLDAKDLNGNETSCQCRYCDPSGQIWDMDVDYLSPSSLNFGSTGYSDNTPSNQADFNRAPSRPYLRRHSSDPQSLLESLSTISLDDDCTSSSLSSASSSTSSVPTTLLSAPNSPNLEVSTEIVTSHNGHRDLEIKFFSIFSGSDIRVDRSVFGGQWLRDTKDTKLSDVEDDRVEEDNQCTKWRNADVIIVWSHFFLCCCCFFFVSCVWVWFWRDQTRRETVVWWCCEIN